MLQWNHPKFVALMLALVTVAAVFGQWSWRLLQWGW